MLGLILAVLLSLFFSTFCSLMEAALLSITWSSIEQIKEKNKKKGILLSNMRTHIDEPISAILTLNTIAHTAGASIAGAFASHLWGDALLPIFVAIFTILILFISEIIPKTLGVTHSTFLCTAFLYPLYGVVLFFKPVYFLTKQITALFTQSQQPLATEDDIKAMVSLSQKTGSINEYEALSINNILSLDTKHVADVMTPRTVVFSLPADITVAELLKDKNSLNYSRIPIYKENNEDIIGIVTRKELLQHREDGDTVRLFEIMQPVHFVLETTKLHTVLQTFLNSRSHLFVVIDEYGGLAGVISLEDVLEEILGREIVDETDTAIDLQKVARQRKARLVQAVNKKNTHVPSGL